VTTGIADAVNVVIDSNGQLGTASSSRRFKKEIKPMDQTSEAILALKPMTFHYKSDTTHTPQFGLIAEEVAKVNPDLVVRDKDGKPYSVRYVQVNAMLLNEFLKEHRKVQKLGKGMEVLRAFVSPRSHRNRSPAVAAPLGRGVASHCDTQSALALVTFFATARKVSGRNEKRSASLGHPERRPQTQNKERKSYYEE
jgi:hypothetical protein